jgi:hypothetical protein
VNKMWLLKLQHPHQISGFPVPHAHPPYSGIILQVWVLVVNIHHNSGASDGKRLRVVQVEDPRREFPCDDVERGCATWRAVPKVEEVDMNEPICDQTLSCWMKK